MRPQRLGWPIDQARVLERRRASEAGARGQSVPVQDDGLFAACDFEQVRGAPDAEAQHRRPCGAMARHRGRVYRPLRLVMPPAAASEPLRSGREPAANDGRQATPTAISTTAIAVRVARNRATK